MILCHTLIYFFMLEDEQKCETISLTECAVLPYNETILPYFFTYKTQEEVKVQLNIFAPLLKAKCSPALEPFLCSVYLPKCSPDGNITRSCRSLCEAASQNCEVAMQELGIVWPEELSCDYLPQNDDCFMVALPGEICLYLIIVVTNYTNMMTFSKLCIYFEAFC